MKIPLYHVDAFTTEAFKGNPAAICPLDAWLDDRLLQSIAAENNLSETAFFVKTDGAYELRWFTSEVEVELCGHATLASAFVIFNEFDRTATEVSFQTKSGMLSVRKEGQNLVLNFPMREVMKCEAPALLLQALRLKPKEAYVTPNKIYMAVFEDEHLVASATPDFNLVQRLDHSVLLTAAGTRCDFVSRYFAPNKGIPEDPVTGSAHCLLVPFWSRRLNKKRLHARQLSRRGGELFCAEMGDRVEIAGPTTLYMKGEIILPEQKT